MNNNLFELYKRGKNLDEALEILKKQTKIDSNEIQNHRSLLHHASNFGHFESSRKKNLLNFFKRCIIFD